MLSRDALNPADVTLLYKMYQAADPPPVELLREPHFLDLLLDALFRPGSRLNPEHRPKYVYLLAYAGSVYETRRKGVRKALNRDELRPTQQAVEKVHATCQERRGSSELVPELAALFQAMRFPVVALGVVHWVQHTVSEPSYFKVSLAAALFSFKCCCLPLRGCYGTGRMGTCYTYVIRRVCCHFATKGRNSETSIN